MRTAEGFNVMVTPSVLYADESAIAGIDAGEGGFIHIRPDGMSLEPGDSNYRTDFVYSIYGTDGDLIHRDEDLHGPATGVAEPALKGLSSLISFLLACVESRSEESENYNLFPTAVREWAECYETELQIIQEEINGEMGEGWNR
jgi:hypothetical protein